MQTVVNNIYNMNSDVRRPVGFPLADLAFERVKSGLGLERCWLPASCAAPLGEEVQAHLWSTGVNLVEMYGLSETCGEST